MMLDFKTIFLVGFVNTRATAVFFTVFRFIGFVSVNAESKSPSFSSKILLRNASSSSLAVLSAGKSLSSLYFPEVEVLLPTDTLLALGMLSKGSLSWM